ncbi:MAG TPA: type I-D CRISPR-associated helicase Cas3' [Ktedonobacteraceae bacterium]|jgi:CRISPR-associated endonuclease/helicase Cas3|nr:type I-D CRISPR-associated helicase Cas3' [Ktedonobacteraceae bacterium]
MKLDLKILPVYSEEYAGAQIGEIHLLKHQVETWEAFGNPEVDVIFNVAMTGDGKSLAAYLPVFQDGKAAIAMYPTNELIQDQFSALPRYEERLGITLPRNALMYGQEITRIMQGRDITVRLNAVRGLLRRNPILLTNPDLVHLIMSHQYGWDYLRKELPTLLSANFDYFIFDEFHVFGVPQIINVMNMLGYLAINYSEKPESRKKFVFLSATPSKLMNTLLQKSGLCVRTVEGTYSSTEKEGYRRILQPCELELHELSQERPIEIWVEEHLEEILSFFRRYPNSKAAILVYSVATARRLYARLYDFFEKQHGITVGENTGLTYRDDRREALKKQILVGTSTVDIGVDFRINYLIFEASNAGSFLQRFGRLGRHADFDTYHAFALVPRFVLERLQNELQAESEVDRERFNAAVRAAFPTEAEFSGYTRRWGVMQAAQVLAALQSEGRKDANDEFLAALTGEYEQLYGWPEQPIMPKKLRQFQYLQKNSPEIVAELSSFRGQSPLSCAVWDVDNHLKTYDLFFLIANTEIEAMTEAEFMAEVRRRIQVRQEQVYERDFRDSLLYLRIHKYIPESQRLVLGLNMDLGGQPQIMHQALELNGFFIQEPVFTWRDRVNKSLKAKRLVCVFSAMPRAELKRKLNLPALFPIQCVQDVTGARYSVAFGQEALLLDSLFSWQRTGQ